MKGSEVLASIRYVWRGPKPGPSHWRIEHSGRDHRVTEALTAASFPSSGAFSHADQSSALLSQVLKQDIPRCVVPLWGQEQKLCASSQSLGWLVKHSRVGLQRPSRCAHHLWINIHGSTGEEGGRAEAGAPGPRDLFVALNPLRGLVGGWGCRFALYLSCLHAEQGGY